ncbi:tol-pal system protein YbgF [Deferrisoma sp.]
MSQASRGWVSLGLSGLAAVLLAGCAAAPPKDEPPSWEPRVQELEQSRARLELRLDEMNRALLGLRARVDALEARLESVARPAEKKGAVREQPELRVIRLEPPEPAPSPAEEPPATLSAPIALYRRAFNAYREGRYGAAILDFEEFVARYPDHEYADNAQYWVGECYYSQGQYEQAIVEFQKVVDRYGHEPKAPDALLKIGLSYERLGEPGKARVFWSRVVEQYPQSEAAREARKKLGG